MIGPKHSDVSDDEQAMKSQDASQVNLTELSDDDRGDVT